MRVLIADDENGVRSMFSHFMEQYPSPYLEYTIVDTGERLRNQCLQNPADVVFTDIKMPDLSGLEAIYEIKEASQDNPASFYVISGYSEFSYAREALRLGIKDYLLKPIRYSTIEEILRKEEKKRFVGLSLDEAWRINDEAEAVRLSELIQNLVSSFHSKAEDYQKILNSWEEMASGYSIPIGIDRDFFCKAFGENIDGYGKQREFLVNMKQEENPAVYSGDIVQRVISSIDKNYGNPSLGLDGIADELGYSTQYLSAIFSREMDMNFSQFLTKKRLDSAKNLLSNTNMKIKDIAEICGYSYTSYFIKVFRKQMGVSPAEWRENRS